MLWKENIGSWTRSNTANGWRRSASTCSRATERPRRRESREAINMDTNAPVYTMDQLRAFDSRVRRIIHRVVLVMGNHKLPVFFRGWVLTATPDGFVVLIGVLDDDRIMAQTNTPLARYLDAKVIHDITTVAGDGQYPV